MGAGDPVGNAMAPGTCLAHARHVMDGTAPVAVQESRPQRFGPSHPSRIFIAALAAVCFGLGCLLVLVGLVSAATSDDGTAGRDLVGSVVDGLLLVTLAVACRRLGRRGVVVDESGVTYVGFSRTRRWTWSQIDSVEMVSVYDDEIGMRYWPRLVLTSGAKVNLRLATSASSNGTSTAGRTVSAVRHGMRTFREPTPTAATM
jgi:hypothetical protein